MIRSRIATAEKFVACDLKISQVQKKKDKEKELKKRESWGVWWKDSGKSTCGLPVFLLE